MLLTEKGSGGEGGGGGSLLQSVQRSIEEISTCWFQVVGDVTCPSNLYNVEVAHVKISVTKFRCVAETLHCSSTKRRDCLPRKQCVCVCEQCGNEEDMAAYTWGNSRVTVRVLTLVWIYGCREHKNIACYVPHKHHTVSEWMCLCVRACVLVSECVSSKSFAYRF